jgi:hypothetical protein
MPLPEMNEESHTAARSRAALAIAFLVGCTVFIECHAERWRKSLVPRGDARTDGGEGLVIRSDGHGYYAWLRSLLFDGDWSFDNEFDEHNPLGDWVPAATPRTERGLRANPWSVGPACVWGLTVVPAHFTWRALEGAHLAPLSTGYELPYQLLVGSTTLAASLLTLLFLYGICRHYARPRGAALAAAMVFLGTTIVYYSAVEVSMAHGLGTAAVAGLIWYWLKTYGSVWPRRWLLVGVLIGFAGLMRWQLVTFAVLPAGECLLMVHRGRLGGDGRSLGKAGGRLGLAALGAFLGLLPQFIAWHAVYGSWVASPMATAQNWLHPSLGAVLLSPDRGLFTWTPLTLAGFAGLAFGGAKSAQPSGATAPGKIRETAALLLVAFVLQVYLVASLLGEEVRLGVAYGFRFLTESVVTLGPGVALLLERSSRRRFRLLAALGCALVLWNLLLIAQYRYGLLPAAGEVGPATFAANAMHFIARKKGRLVAQVLLGPLLVWLLLGRPPAGGQKVTASAGSRIAEPL